MARLSNTTSPIQSAGFSNSPFSSSTHHLNSSALDIACAELGQLLDRLQRTVLHADAERERRLRASEFERSRVEANLEYARTNLTKLEQDALGIKAPGRRSEVQGDLNKKRELLELLMDRLEDLRQIAAETDEGDATSDDEDILGDIIPTPSESAESTAADVRTQPIEEEAGEWHRRPPAGQSIPNIPAASPAHASQPDPETTTEDLPTQTSQILRNRGSAPSPTPSSHSSARAALFANRRKTPNTETGASTATAEAILDQQRAEQDALSESILKMAGSLKASSQKFSTTLEQDKEVVSRAGEGIDKTERGMEAARGRMGALRRMTEGKGWWGRIILYAWVYGLMVGLILLVFVMPKLRF